MRLQFLIQRKKELGLTNATLSAKSGIPLTTTAKIMAGIIQDPKFHTLQALAQALECSIDDFYDESVPLVPKENHSGENVNNLNSNTGIKKIIAINIKRYRQAAGLSQKDLSAKIGVASSAVSNWENSQNSIDIERLYDMCKVLDVAICDMFIDPSITYTTQTDKKERMLDIDAKCLSPEKLHLIQAIQSLPDEHVSSLISCLKHFGNKLT